MTKRILLLSILALCGLSAAQVTTLGGGGIGISCNAITVATSANPAQPGGCTSLNLVTVGGQLPSTYTWQIITTGAPATVTVNFMGSLDGSTWVQLDTASSATTRTVSPSAAYRFLGCVPATLTGGTAPTVTCQVSVAGGGGVLANNGTAGAIATFSAAGGSSAVSPDALLFDNGTQLNYFGTGGLQLFSAAGPEIIPINVNVGAFEINSAVGAGWGASGLRLTSGGILQMTSGALNAGLDTGISRQAAGVVAIGTSAAASTNGRVKASGYMSVGTTFTSNAGCTDTALTGGATAGTFTTGATGACTTIITMGDTATAPNGWACACTDRSSAGDTCRQTATAATTASISLVTSVATDVIVFSCIGY